MTFESWWNSLLPAPPAIEENDPDEDTEQMPGWCPICGDRLEEAVSPDGKLWARFCRRHPHINKTMPNPDCVNTDCPTCHGTGGWTQTEDGYEPCSECGGSGSVKEESNDTNR